MLLTIIHECIVWRFISNNIYGFFMVLNMDINKKSMLLNYNSHGWRHTFRHQLDVTVSTHSIFWD